jgi:serine/threonine-protein kinase
MWMPAVEVPAGTAEQEYATVVVGEAEQAPPQRVSAFGDDGRFSDGIAPGGTAPFRVGPYEVATRIARGAMGSVYVCRRVAESNPDRLLTLKVVRQHTVRQELATDSFRHEALVGSLFHHPSAQTVIDSGVYEGQPYLILDYVDGLCLADVLAQETPPTPAVAVAIILDVLAALQALHRTHDSAGKWLGLLHCDISPENILVGVDGVARLADFGSVRFTARNNQSQPFAISKPSYMPPEQFRGDKLDSRADLYSVGVLLWTILTGQQPFAAESYDRVALNVMRKNIKPPSSHGAPDCLDEVCMQAISRSADGRFVVADAMATALRSAALTKNLVESREGVGRWVAQAAGSELTERRQRIEAAFSGAGNRSQNIRSGEISPPPMRWAEPERDGSGPSMRETHVMVEQTMMSQTVMSSPARPASPIAPRAVEPKLTARQRTIIAAASALAFLLTVVIGLALSSRNRGGHAHTQVLVPAVPSVSVAVGAPVEPSP